MKILLALPLAAALAAAPLAALAEDGGIDAAKAGAFEAKVFGGPVGDKASACFVRRYDAGHLAQHPKQKVTAMKLLVTAENHPGEPTSYAYKAGFQFRHRAGNFDAGSGCGRIEDGARQIHLACDGDCGSGGIDMATSKDGKSMIVHLEAIPIRDRDHPDGDEQTLEAGADDKAFRIDRVDIGECAELLADHKDVASLQRR